MAEKMKLIRIPAVVLLSLLTLSCRNTVPSTDVLRGNMSYGRGQYQKAILQYLGAEDGASSGADVINYNLANVYFALGEGDAALQAWSLAENNTDNTDILFRIAFNRGVLYYHRGKYDEAYRSFRRALILRPSDIDAKINLEESLSRIRFTAAQPQEGSEEVSDDSGGEEEKRLLDYVRRKEAEAWTVQDEADSTDIEDW